MRKLRAIHGNERNRTAIFREPSLPGVTTVGTKMVEDEEGETEAMVRTDKEAGVMLDS